MGVAEHAVEEHFTEGEPDLEPPEEMAIGELDDETMLEEELDNEDIDEQDVDEDLLEVTLEDLVHVDDDVEEDDTEIRRAPVVEAAQSGADTAADTDSDVELDLDDVEESLDRILQVRMALEEIDLDEEDDLPKMVAEVITGDDVVAPCRPDEFVCMGCFLVMNQVLLSDTRAMLCRDCAS